VALGAFAGTGIVHGSNVIAIGIAGVSSVFGEVDHSCYVGNISGATVDTNTIHFVFVDSDGKLGTVPVDANGNKTTVPSPQGAQPRAMLRKVEEQAASIAALKSTVAQQQKGMEILRAQLKEQATQIQRVSVQGEVSKPASKVVTGP
jgi:uncharacterized coiled-coil protein SlyX